MRVQPKCAICHLKRSDIIWQPFGPDESPLLFVRPGYHYRGFRCVHICSDCEAKIKKGMGVTFRCKDGVYAFSNGEMKCLIRRAIHE